MTHDSKAKRYYYFDTNPQPRVTRNDMEGVNILGFILNIACMVVNRERKNSRCYCSRFTCLFPQGSQNLQFRCLDSW
jgi:hypothetical protein